MKKCQKIGMQPEFFTHADAFIKPQKDKSDLLHKVDIKIKPEKINFNSINHDDYFKMLKFDSIKNYNSIRLNNINPYKKKEETIKLVDGIIFEKKLHEPKLYNREINPIAANKHIHGFIKSNVRSNELKQNVNIVEFFNANRKVFDELQKQQKRYEIKQSFNPILKPEHRPFTNTKVNIHTNKNIIQNLQSIMPRFQGSKYNETRTFKSHNIPMEQKANINISAFKNYNIIKQNLNNLLKNSYLNRQNIPQVHNARIFSNVNKKFDIKNNINTINANIIPSLIGKNQQSFAIETCDKIRSKPLSSYSNIAPKLTTIQPFNKKPNYNIKPKTNLLTSANIDLSSFRVKPLKSSKTIRD